MKGQRQKQKTGQGAKASRRRAATRSELEEHRAAISEVLRVIANSPHELQPIFDIILSNATRLCRAKIGTLRLREEKGFRLVAHIGLSASLRPSIPILLEPNLSPYVHVAATRSPIQIRDATLNERFIRGHTSVVNAAKAGGIHTYLIVPMVKEEEIIGTLHLGRAAVQSFTSKQIEMVTDFAAQATIALENTRRERQFRDLQREMAHANRVATMGQLTASIVHEVKQPIAATITNAQAALRMLGSQPAALNELRQIFNDIVTDCNRANKVIDSIRYLVKRAPPRKESFDVNEAIREVIVVTRGEAMKNGVSVQTQLTEGLPFIEGDRVQLQRVILNLIINAVEAMSGLPEGLRELNISTENTESEGVCVAVGDSGPGLSPENLRQLFDPFYTTKPYGMGLGLSICRSIIEAHGGRLTATANNHPWRHFSIHAADWPGRGVLIQAVSKAQCGGPMMPIADAHTFPTNFFPQRIPDAS